MITREEVAAYLSTRTTGRLWGSEHTISPRLVTDVQGSGGAFLFLEPMNHRPNFYVIEVEPQIAADENDEVSEIIEEIYELVEADFGTEESEETLIREGTEELGREPTEAELERAWQWPIPNFEGVAWGEFDIPAPWLAEFRAKTEQCPLPVTHEEEVN